MQQEVLTLRTNFLRSYYRQVTYSLRPSRDIESAQGPRRG